VGKQHSIQLAFDFAAVERDFVLTRPLSRHRSRDALVRKLHYVRRFFPELDGQTIRVGLTRTASGLAIPGGVELWVHPSQTSYHTLAHEFIHLLQGKHGIPTGERSCDIYALARHWTLNDSPPYYVKLPAEFRTSSGNIRPEYAKLIWTTARRAVEMRQAGTRNYISYFEKTLERHGPSPRRPRRAPSRPSASALAALTDEGASRRPRS